MDNAQIAPHVEALKSTDSRVRLNALTALAGYMHKEAIYLLMAATHYFPLPSSDYQANVNKLIKNLAESDREKFIGTLIDVIEHPLGNCDIGDKKIDGDFVVSTAIEFLGKFGNESVIETLVKVLHTPRQTRFGKYPRESAARALGQLGGARATIALIKSLTDEEINIVKGVIDALEIIGDPGTALPLAECLKHPSAIVRRHVLNTLGKIGDEQILPLMRMVTAENNDADGMLGFIGTWAISEVEERVKQGKQAPALFDDTVPRTIAI